MVISTFYTNDHKGGEMVKPLAILDYNAAQKGVDVQCAFIHIAFLLDQGSMLSLKFEI